LSNQYDDCDIALINPPHHSFGRVKRIRKTSPPLGIMYIGTFLQNKGYRVRVIDGMLQPNLLEDTAIAKSSFRVVGITCTTPTVASALLVARKIKENKPDCTVVLGGPHASVCYEELIQKEDVDYVVVGEGEYPFESISRSVLDNKDIHDWAGIIDKDGSQGFLGTKYIDDLDSIPFPDRRLIPLTQYELSPINYKWKPSTPLITTRGCPFGCTFCSNPVHGKRVRHHSPNYILKEIKYLIKDFRVRDVMFWDDTFTLNATRVENICNLMLKEKLDISWSCAGRVDRVDGDLLKLMKRAGCWQISFGVESGSERLLKNIRKGISKSQIISAFDLCREIGIETRAFFMLGIPSETMAESLETIEFAKKLNPSYAQFSLAVPYPGSQWYDEAIAGGWSPPKWEYFNTYPQDKPVYVPSGMNEKELLDLQTLGVKTFYFRPSYILSRLRHINSTDAFIKHVKVAINLLSF